MFAIEFVSFNELMMKKCMNLKLKGDRLGMLHYAEFQMVDNTSLVDNE